MPVRQARRTDRPRAASPRRAGWAIGLVLAALVSESAAQARVFRVADIQAEDYPTVQALAFMDRLLRDRSGGRHGLQIFHSRQLGEERETVDQTRAGGIDIARVNIAPLTSLFPAANALALPFVFRSEEHLHRVLDGPIGADVLQGFEPYGLIGLGFYDSGTRSIYNAERPVVVPADLAGLRIRVQQSDVMVEMMRALGADPVPLAYGQVGSALETKLIDGAENNWPSYVTTGHFTLARFITETRHTMPPEVLVMSPRAWGELSAEDQALMREVARDSSRFMRTRWREWVANTRAQAASAGVAIVTAFDRPAFEAAVRASGERFLADPRTRALVDRIRDAP